MIEELQQLNAFWTVESKYDLLRGRRYFHAHIFDGDACVSGGVGEVSGWQEVNIKSESLEQAVSEALLRWNAGQFDKAKA